VLRIICLTASLVGMALPAHADTSPDLEIDPPPDGSVSVEDGLAAWARIHEVTSHPRCANCHVGATGRPMWSGPSYGEPRPHGMNIQAGESRIGAERILCATCHVTSTRGNDTPHAAPRAGLDWRLPPAEFQWFGKSSRQICNQLRDPERNGGRDAHGLAEHLVEDVGHEGFVLWGWQPGGTREPAPYSPQAHVDDMLAWGAAGQPCPGD